MQINWSWVQCKDNAVFDPGMNAAVRAVTRMGIYVGAKVYLIHEVNKSFTTASEHADRPMSHPVLWLFWNWLQCSCDISGISRLGGWRREHKAGTLAQCDQHYPAGGLKVITVFWENDHFTKWKWSWYPCVPFWCHLILSVLYQFA